MTVLRGGTVTISDTRSGPRSPGGGDRMARTGAGDTPGDQQYDRGGQHDSPQGQADSPPPCSLPWAVLDAYRVDDGRGRGAGWPRRHRDAGDRQIGQLRQGSDRRCLDVLAPRIINALALGMLTLGAAALRVPPLRVPPLGMALDVATVRRPTLLMVTLLVVTLPVMTLLMVTLLVETSMVLVRCSAHGSTVPDDHSGARGNHRFGTVGTAALATGHTFLPEAHTTPKRPIDA